MQVFDLLGLCVGAVKQWNSESRSKAMYSEAVGGLGFLKPGVQVLDLVGLCVGAATQSAIKHMMSKVLCM